MKKLLFCAAALLAAVSCASDDDPVSDDDMLAAHNIIGTWQIVHSEGWESGAPGGKDQWSKDYSENSDEYWTYTFDQEGTCKHTVYTPALGEGVVESHYHPYLISGRTLTLYLEDEIPKITEIYQIKTLTKSQLVLFLKDEDSNGSIEFTDTYERVK